MRRPLAINIFSISQDRHMDAMLESIEAAMASRTNIYNATKIGISALDGRANLEYPSEQLRNALESSDFERAHFAFDVLNKMCGDRLPTPNFISPRAFGDGSCMATSNGSSLSYQSKVMVATDMINAIGRITSELIPLYAQAIATAQRCGNTAIEFVRVLPVLYM